jgi:tetratricopeptide (TPR) repeat protein
MPTQDHLSAGAQALASGDWNAAKESFEAARREVDSSESLDGLGRALWWLKDVRAAIETRTRAYGAYREETRNQEAAAVAVWLARELRILLRNDAAADGWLARAETLSKDVVDSSVPGWVALARAETRSEVSDAIADCESALGIARELNDPDLEIVSLARLGLFQVAQGAVDLGIALLDEAMAAASGGEAKDLQSVGEAYCALMEAAELLGDSERFAQWTSAIAELKGQHGFGPFDDLGSSTAYGNLSSFCGACCGGMYLVTGRLDEAEDELRDAIVDLETSGMDPRCVHPVTQLAELRVLQGRLEEARALLERYEDLPESAALWPFSIWLSGRRMRRLHDCKGRLEELRSLTVAALPLWTVLIDAQIVRGALEAAADAAKQIAKIAALTKSKRHLGEALFAEGKVAAANSKEDAPGILREAARTLSEASIALPACRARMQLAQTLVDRDRPWRSPRPVRLWQRSIGSERSQMRMKPPRS